MPDAPPLELVVAAVDDGVPDVRTVTLARRDGGSLPGYPAGSHVVLECNGTANAYSLLGDGLAPRSYVVSVLHCPDGAGGSRWVHGLGVGDTVRVRPPRSAFPPVLRAVRHLYVAAGIGITPVLSHLRSARRWGRDARVLYLHRPGRPAHRDDVAGLVGDRAAFFTDRRSFVAALTPTLVAQPLGTHLYLCGPSGFLDDVTALAEDLGWPASRVHLERFRVDALDPGDPFEVRLTRTGGTIGVPAGVSLLEALEARGVEVPSMCRQGVCGECRVPVSAGEVLHRDLYLTEHDKQAGDALMACVSRAAGDHLEVAL